MIDFIGIGAQKSGTSWIYACLFEHPEICIPIKEIHFFSRARFKKGREWYEGYFKRCDAKKRKGEFSTSYLYSESAPKRISALYPDVKVIAVLREPVARAYSQYRNAIKAGEVSKESSFETYLKEVESCVGQGLYSAQLRRYFDVFGTSQVLVLVYEDIAKNPAKFMQSIYGHIGVDDTFIPPSLESRINTARTPKSVYVDSVIHAVAEFLRRYGSGRLVHMIKRSGVTDAIRTVNTKKIDKEEKTVDLEQYKKYYKDDVWKVQDLIGIDVVTKWRYD